MSRLIKIDPNIQLDQEVEGHELGYYVLNSLPDINTVSKQEVLVNMHDNAISAQSTNIDVGIPNAEIQDLKKDNFCNLFSTCYTRNIFIWTSTFH